MRLFLVKYGSREQIIEAPDVRGALTQFYKQRHSHSGRADIRVRLATNADIKRVNGDTP